jgi:hypothetical protein
MGAIASSVLAYSEHVGGLRDPRVDEFLRSGMRKLIAAGCAATLSPAALEADANLSGHLCRSGRRWRSPSACCAALGAIIGPLYHAKESWVGRSALSLPPLDGIIVGGSGRAYAARSP